MYIKQGVTRIVLLTKRYAIKIPNFTYSYNNFLRGILCNLQETFWSKEMSGVKLCPVLFSSWGAFVIIMPRAKEINKDTFDNIVLDDFKDIPVEYKIDSFGEYQGNIVAIDYGD